MTEIPDDDLRDAFGPLRHQTATAAEIQAVIARRGIERSARRRRASRLGVMAVLPIVTAVSVIVALAPTPDDGEGGPATAFLPERAEAAIAPVQRILELTTHVEYSSTESAAPLRPAVNVKQWSLAGAGDATQARALITEGSLERPPTDEDTTTLLDRAGRIVEMRSWTPIGTGRRGRLELVELPRHLQDAGPEPLTRALRRSYEQRLLRPAGRTPDGALMLRGRLYGFPCERTEVLLDPRTFIPRRIETVTQATPRPAPCRGDAPVRREVQTITSARVLPATPENRRLLQIGDWPVTTTGRLRITERPVPNSRRVTPHSEFTPLERLPPPPSLDEG